MKACCESAHACQKKSHPGKAISIALVGNPNCGKTTLFNVLTGAHQRVGNWPGVTVERKSGFFSEYGAEVEVIDLPGIYSLTVATETAAIDERIASKFVRERCVDVIVNIVDASNLERHLYLTTQLLEMGAPMVVALTMMDAAHARGINIDIAKLARELGCPVIAMAANKGMGVSELKQAITAGTIVGSQKAIPYQPELRDAILAVAQSTSSAQAYWLAIQLLEDDACARQQVNATTLEQVQVQQVHIKQQLHEDADILIADARYRYIQAIMQQFVTQTTRTKPSWTTRIDHLVLHRVLGIPVFLGVMYLLFLFAINIGGAFQDFFDSSSQAIFVDGFAYLLNQLGAPTWVTAILANGIGKGINTTITFIPVIGALFLFLALLEDSGYMARAAFVIDRCMRMLGLPGKAFVPMIVGFGCNVPAVMAARTLENKRDRILTIMMTPFMSCGARLAIYAVFTAAFFPHGGQNVVFLLYLIGIFMAVITGFILRKTLLKGEPAPLVMELPSYHIPHASTLLLHAWQRLKSFVFRAGKLIVPICMLIGALNSLNIDGTINTGDGDVRSLLSIVGQAVTPLFAPMGITADNWPATVGLVTGVLAKEVVVGTLNTLYTQMGHLAVAGSFDYQGVYGLMYQKFDGKAGAFAYLLFVLLYFPCVSTTAAMLRELHRGWSVFSIAWMTGIAYGTAVTFYQAATWSRHPLTSSIWIMMMMGVFFITIALARAYANRDKAYLEEASHEFA